MKYSSIIVILCSLLWLSTLPWANYSNSGSMLFDLPSFEGVRFFFYPLAQLINFFTLIFLPLFFGYIFGMDQILSKKTFLWKIPLFTFCISFFMTVLGGGFQFYNEIKYSYIDLDYLLRAYDTIAYALTMFVFHILVSFLIALRNFSKVIYTSLIWFVFSLLIIFTSIFDLYKDSLAQGTSVGVDFLITIVNLSVFVLTIFLPIYIPNRLFDIKNSSLVWKSPLSTFLISAFINSINILSVNAVVSRRYCSGEAGLGCAIIFTGGIVLFISITVIITVISLTIALIKYSRFNKEVKSKAKKSLD